MSSTREAHGRTSETEQGATRKLATTMHRSATLPGMRSALDFDRATTYGRACAILQQDGEVAGAEAVFDQALSNALAAIVASEWPGAEQDNRGRVKSAATLLEVILAKTHQESAGVFVLPRRSITGESVRVRAKTLREAIDRTQGPRHGRGGSSSLTDSDVAALAELDEHPALGSLHDEHLDGSWRRSQVKDLESRSHAERYLSLLGEDEVSRRRDSVQDSLPWDPKERDACLDPQECPVCDSEALLVSEVDIFGVGVGAGTCFVCSYHRSPSVAYDEAMTVHLDYVVNKDD